MSIDKVSKGSSTLISAHPSKDSRLEGNKRHRGSPTINLNGFAYHFYDGEARRSMARIALSLSQKKKNRRLPDQ